MHDCGRQVCRLTTGLPRAHADCLNPDLLLAKQVRGFRPSSEKGSVPCISHLIVHSSPEKRLNSSSRPLPTGTFPVTGSSQRNAMRCLKVSSASTKRCLLLRAHMPSKWQPCCSKSN